MVQNLVFYSQDIINFLFLHTPINMLDYSNQYNSLTQVDIDIILLTSELNYRTLKTILKHPFFVWNFESLSSLYVLYYMENWMLFIIDCNRWILQKKYITIYLTQNITYFPHIVINLFKFSHLLYLTLIIICFQNKTLKLKISITTLLNRIFILNESEKELGAMDDSIGFILVFLITIFSFLVFISLILIFKNITFIWLFSGLILSLVLILSIPLNVLFDFGLNFSVYVRGSSLTSNIIIESFFDFIAVSILIIRFIIQNIRFVFIFSAIFELFEWTFFTNSNLLINQFIFKDFNNFLNFELNSSSFNIILINLLLSIIYYLYYLLHLIFLLFAQVSIYILVAIWLFFFLYTSFFLNKTEKFFLYKKILKN